MINTKYYEEFQGENAVKIWIDEGGEESGLLVWRGFFEAVLEGCFKKDFQKGGLVECYYFQNGFFDDTWCMKSPEVVLHELTGFDETQLKHLDKEIVLKSKEIIQYLLFFVRTATNLKQRINIEYI